MGKISTLRTHSSSGAPFATHSSSCRRHTQQKRKHTQKQHQPRRQHQHPSVGSSLYSLNTSIADNGKRMSMNPQQFLLVCLSLFLLFFTHLSHLSLADVGTTASYAPPYIPTACSGNDGSQFPSSNLFAAAGEGIWDNGAACGRQYLVRCISAAAPNSCNPSQTIQVKIVDRAQTSASRPSRGGTTMVLSTTAFGAIANGSPPSINIEFQQGLKWTTAKDIYV
ncbi:unnamed protein product [Camellia sinensis]